MADDLSNGVRTIAKTPHLLYIAVNLIVVLHWYDRPSCEISIILPQLVGLLSGIC